jgi:hypothetical protein
LPPEKRNSSGSDSVWDGVVGVRGRYELSDKWYVSYHADLGTGDSDYTWQVLGSFGYRFERFDAIFGYRHLEWSFDGEGALDALDISGPMAGIRYRF